MFDESIRLILDRDYNDIEFTLKINNKYYTSNEFTFNYRLNKIINIIDDSMCETYMLYDEHNKFNYKCYNITGLLMFENNNEYANCFFTQRDRLRQQKEYNECKYPYPQLIKLFNEIHTDFPQKITNFPKYTYSPILLPDITENINNNLPENGCNYIYIIQEREFINANQPVYKIGKTTKEIQKRCSQYPKSSKLLFTQHVDNCHEVEKNIIKKLTENFKNRKDIGREYFEGNIKNIMKDVFEICNNN
jgi:hypothetical protein